MKSLGEKAPAQAHRLATCSGWTRGRNGGSWLGGLLRRGAYLMTSAAPIDQ